MGVDEDSHGEGEGLHVIAELLERSIEIRMHHDLALRAPETPDALGSLDRNDARDRLTIAGEDDILPTARLVDQLRQSFLRLLHVDRALGHSSPRKTTTGLTLSNLTRRRIDFQNR